MTGHTEVPNLIYELMECCEITELQFLILLAAYRWLNRAAGRVDSFSAERVCRFYKWDATEAKLREVRRAVHDLVKYGIVSRDYRKGDKRPYHLWLPKENETLSLCIARVRDPVSDPVSEENEVTDAGSVNSEEEPSVGVRDPVSENAPLLSATNQYDQNQERESPLPPLGVPPPALRGHSEAVGLFSKSKAAQERQPLTAEQCKQLDAVMNAFSAEWSQHHGFDPKTEDLLRLLKHYSPLEIVFAYEYLCHGKKKKIPTNQIAVFFNRTAAKIIQDRGIRGEFGLIHPLGQLVRDEDPSHWGSNFNSVQAQWCAVFDQPPPWLFWTSEELDDDMRIWVAFHFYDPECRRDWVRLQIDQGLLPELRESESESKTIQHFVDWVYRCVGWGPPEKAITLALRNYEKEIIATAWTLYLEDHHKSLDDAKAFWIGGKINQWIGRARRKKQEEKENPDAEKHAREAAEKKRLADAAEAETRIQVEAEQKAQWAREAPAREAKAAEEKAFREKVNETMSKVQGWNQDSDGNWRHNRVVYRVGASSVSEVNAVGSLPIAIEELEKWARSEVGLKSKEAS